MREAPNLSNFEWALKMALETPPEEYFSDEAVQPTNMFAKLMHSPRNRLRQFCYYVENDEEIPKETLQWLADASKQYLDGKRHLVTALGLEKQDKSPRRIKNFRAGMRMFALMNCKGEKHVVATDKVKEESGLSERHIQTHYAEVRDCAEAFGWCKKNE